MATKGSEAPTSIRFPAHLKRELRMAAASEDSTMEDVIIECFRVWKEWRAGRLLGQRKPVALTKETEYPVLVSRETAELLAELLRITPETWLQQLLKDLLLLRTYASQPQAHQISGPVSQPAELPELPHPNLADEPYKAAPGKDQPGMGGKVRSKSKSGSTRAS